MMELMIALVEQKRKIVLTLVKKKFILQPDGSYIFVNQTEIITFCLQSISKKFTKDEQSETSLNGTAHDFSAEIG